MIEKSNLEKENEDLKNQLNNLQKKFSQLILVKKQLEDVINNVPIVMYVLDKEGVFTLSEGAGLADLGLRSGEVVGLSVYDVYSDYPDIIEAHKKAFQGIEQSYSVKIQGRQKVNDLMLTEEAHYDARTKPIYNDKKEIDGVIGIAYNTTYLRKAEKRLAENETRYRTLINESPLGVLVIQQGIAKFANPRLLAIFGFDELNEIIDRPSKELLAPEVREEMSERASRREKGEQLVSSYETSCQKRDGTIFPVHIDARRIIFNDKPSVMLYFRDITEVRKLSEERDQLKKQLQLAQKLESLGIVAGGVAHDFNNLLFGIMGYANLILNKDTSDKEVSEYANEIYSISKEATTLTKQMLAYTGKSVLNQVVTSFNDIINEIKKLIKLSIPKSISIHYELTENPDRIIADINQVKQVILNLVINASEAIGKSSGSIVITTGSEMIDEKEQGKGHPIFDLQIGKYSFIEIRDSGIGIEESIVNKIFDPFYSTKFTGRGLGLSVVQGIIKAHKGSIKIESQIGTGSIFKVLFPVTHEKETPSDSKEPNLEKLEKTGTVIFCDDDENIRTIGKKMLEKIGFTTLLASNGLEAIEIYNDMKDDIVLIISDLTMPEMTGREVLTRLQNLSPHLPIIISSGYNEIEVSGYIKNKKNIGFLQKPYNLSDLQSMIRKVLS